MTLLYRQNESGQPWARTSGSAPGRPPGRARRGSAVAQRHVEPGMPGQRRLLRGPVEPVGPVGDELPQVVEVGAHDQPASSGDSGQRVARNRARRSSSASGVVGGVNGRGMGHPMTR